MSIDDNAALTVLLARYVEAMDEGDIEKQLVADANARLAQQSTKITHLRSAFAAFGFELGEKEVWDRMGAQIGKETYIASIQNGRAAIIGKTLTTTTTTSGGSVFTTKITTNLAPPPTASGAVDSTSVTHAAEGIGVTATGIASIAGPSTSSAARLPASGGVEDDTAEDVLRDYGSPEVAETVTPRVRDAVVERLRLAGDKGLKATRASSVLRKRFRY